MFPAILGLFAWVPFKIHGLTSSRVLNFVLTFSGTRDIVTVEVHQFIKFLRGLAG
jgi:hypothetical protein